MVFLISSQNVFNYLVRQNLFELQEQPLTQVEPKVAKNFNLLLSLPDERKLLVKQERLDSEGKTADEFLNEWRIQEFLQRFPELSYIRLMVSEVLHFDAEHSIIVFNYLNDYCDLAEFYTKENVSLLRSQLQSELL